MGVRKGCNGKQGSRQGQGTRQGNYQGVSRLDLFVDKNIKMRQRQGARIKMKARAKTMKAMVEVQVMIQEALILEFTSHLMSHRLNILSRDGGEKAPQCRQGYIFSRLGGTTRTRKLDKYFYGAGNYLDRNWERPQRVSCPAARTSKRQTRHQT